MQTPSPRSLLAVLLSTVLFSCGGEKPPAASFELLDGVPALPGSQPVTSAAGSDAVQAGYIAAEPADSVASWYRRWLLKDGWEITGDLRAGNGEVTLHAEKAGRPLWLIIQPSADGLTTRYSVIGAQQDSSKTPGPGH